MIKLPQYLYFSQAVEFVLNIQIKLKSQRITILCCYLNIKNDPDRIYFKEVNFIKARETFLSSIIVCFNQLCSTLVIS